MDKPKILIVDDDQEVVEAISIRLAAEGFQCVGAYSADDGFALFKAGGIDLVITDVIMPMSDGFSMVHWIRQVSDVPIIVITGFDRCRQAFLSDFPQIRCIAKPYESAQVVRLVRAELAAHRDKAIK